MIKILIVEDEEAIANLIRMNLVKAGYQCEIASDGEEAANAIQERTFDLILLDIMLPKLNGYEVLEYAKTVDTPVIFLTAMGETQQKVKGLKLGAEDYIAKPFNPLELIARVKAQLRRFTQYNEERRPAENVIDFAGLVLNKDTHECIYNEKELVLTPIEFNILWILCENRGQVISSEELFEQVWGEKYFKNSNNTVMVHIRHLREKMSDTTGRTDFIKTVWGVGYKIEK